MNDQQAIQSLKRGEIGALDHLVTTYQQKAIRTACLITRDEETARDAVQETFLRIYRRIRQFDETRPFEPYLLRSVINTAINLAEKSRREVSLDESLQQVDLTTLIQRATSTEDQVEYLEFKEKVREGLGKLAPRERAVLVERYYLDLSESEMAQEHQVAPGTVKWMLHAARKRLRTVLGLEKNRS